MSKFITRNPNSGRLEEAQAAAVSAGASDAGRIPKLDASGKLDQSLMPSGLGSETQAAVATEALSAGDFVNIYDNAGTKAVRKADASTAGKEANGFVIASVAISASATVYTDGANTQMTGLVAGRVYFLGSTPGSVTSTPLTAAGQIHQRLGVAATTTSLVFEHYDPITLA